MWNNKSLEVPESPGENYICVLVQHVDYVYWAWTPIVGEEFEIMAKNIIDNWDNFLKTKDRDYQGTWYEYTIKKCGGDAIVTATPYRGEEVTFIFLNIN